MVLVPLFRVVVHVIDLLQQSLRGEPLIPLPPKGSKTKNQEEEWETLVEQRSLSAPLKAKVLEWLRYKAERKELYKPTGLKSFLTEMENKAREYAEGDIISLINECMANNWRGIIWDKIKGKENKKGERYEFLI